jgi:hypothetical protein
MRKLYTSLLAVLIVNLTLGQTAQPKNNITNADWGRPNDWVGNRNPKNGDIVEIPVGKTVSVNANFTHTTMRINVQGTLNISGGSLSYTENTAVINVLTDGIVQSFNRVEAERILIASVVKLQGNLFYSGNNQNHQGKVVGPAYATSSTGSGSSGFSFGLLPVTLSEFTLSSESGRVVLKWKTTQEINSSRFDVERSSDGSSWKQVGSVNAAGFSSVPKQYGFSDESAGNGVNYYRLKMIDADGSFKYSTIKAAFHGDQKATVRVFPNPASTSVTVYVNTSARNEDVRVSVLNNMGQVIQQTKLEKDANSLSIDVRLLPEGRYLVRLSTNSGFTEVQPFIVRKK